MHNESKSWAQEGVKQPASTQTEEDSQESNPEGGRESEGCRSTTAAMQ